MKRKNILAHRGWWHTLDEKNSMTALQRAVVEGFGVETDLRDLNGEVVISHDPPVDLTLTAQIFMDFYASAGADGRLALNIKADGIQKLILNLVSEACISLENCFVFDMAVPDAIGYIELGIPTYTRISEYEAAPYLGRSAGVWVDSFNGDLPPVVNAKRLLEAGYRACIVSPELHQRPYLTLWQEIRSAGLQNYALFELCTDLPQDAYEYFGTE
jgi:hypothetical protein